MIPFDRFPKKTSRTTILKLCTSASGEAFQAKPTSGAKYPRVPASMVVTRCFGAVSPARNHPDEH
ncbi:hypothetical protein SLEP1_g1683 [Rubroshorea leprosula]|uniref:Uncharacterized protein n=1 Tax=Rubroshorea leprosula TaxID=152421 RepID=A0AAV5HP35_9ROSI|nr:hypothetical protein SLEP1_g1683 [Rubroshorea leprosula]